MYPYINRTVVEYFPFRIPRGCTLTYIRWTTRKSDRSPRDRFSRAHIRERKEISAMPPSGVALYPSRSVHVCRNSDPTGIASGISKTDWLAAAHRIYDIMQIYWNFIHHRHQRFLFLSFSSIHRPHSRHEANDGVRIEERTK